MPTKKKTAPKKEAIKKKAPAKPQAKKLTKIQKQAKALKAARDRINPKVLKKGQKPSIVTLSDPKEHLKAYVPGVVSTGCIALDRLLMILGLPQGRMVEIFGWEGVAKSTHLYEILRQALWMGGTALLGDTEVTTTRPYCENLGMDTSPTGLQILQEKNAEAWFEGLYKWLEGVADYAKPIVIGWDSVGGTSTKHADASKPGDPKKVADMAGILHKELRKLNEIFTQHDILFVVTNRRYGSLKSGPSEEIHTVGGRAFPFWATVRIELQTWGGKNWTLWPWNAPKDISTFNMKQHHMKPLGMMSLMKTYKNKVEGAHANMQDVSCLEFGRGTNNYWSLFNELRLEGYLTGGQGVKVHRFTSKDDFLKTIPWEWPSCYGFWGFEEMFRRENPDKAKEIWHYMIKLYNNFGYKASSMEI